MVNQHQDPKFQREADAVWLDALRKMGMEGRARLTFRLSANLRRISEQGIKYRHPKYTDRQVKLAAMRLAWGDALWKQVFPHEDVEP